MVSNSEIIKNDIFRYKFINQFIKGKILDHKSNTFTLYHSAKILLEKNVVEVNSLMNLSDKELTTRKIDSHGSIRFQHTIKNNIDTNFDGVISFQNLNQENILEHIEFYHNVLKDNGILVLSVSNKRKNIMDHKEKDNEFNLNELKKIINSKFKIIEVFSHRFKEKPVVNYNAVMFRIAKKKLAVVLNKMDKVKQFYQKNMKEIISKHDPYKEYFHKIPDDDFVPKKYQNNHNSLFLILICKKM